MEWQDVNSPANKSFKAQPSEGKMMCAVFWNKRGMILLDFLKTRQTINSDCYIMTLTKLKVQISRVRPEKKTTFLLQLNNTRFHTSVKTIEHTAHLGWTILPHALYRPDLVPSKFHLFGPVKDVLDRQHLPSQHHHCVSFEIGNHLCCCRFLQAWHAGPCSSLAKNAELMVVNMLKDVL